MTGVVVLLVNFKFYKDALKVTREVSIRPSRIMVQEANGKIFWQTSNVHLGLPITPIKDLGHKKTRVLLVIIVSTSPVRWKRREAIRNTWWRYCNSTEVACHFFTDGRNTDKEIQRQLLTEKLRYDDIKFQPLNGGREFGLRFLYHAMWASATYDFQYFLRADDDYFVCLKKLLHELPLRPKQNLCWGHFHCEPPITWIDESWMIFTPDIIESFLKQDARTMLCHPHADQQIAIWLNNMSNRVYFHDERLILDRKDSFDVGAGNVCEKYLGIHQAYAPQMLLLGKNSGDNGAKQVPPVSNFSEHCKHTTFNYKVFEGGDFFFKPRPCVSNIEWVKTNRLWIGREGKL